MGLFGAPVAHEDDPERAIRAAAGYTLGQFHPELRSRPTRPHPLFREFVGAAQAYRRAQAARPLSITR